MQGIYCIEHLESGRRYYGSSMNVEKRLTGHKRELRNQIHHNVQLQRSVNKYGIIKFKFFLVEETQFATRKELLLYEQTYLDKNCGGYNMAPANGGDTISKHPDNIAIRAKISQSVLLRNQKLTDKEKKIKYGNAGSKNGMFGKTHTREVKDKLRTKATGNSYAVGAFRSPEYREKISKAMKGNLVGDKNPFYGKHHTTETKQILREKMSGENSWIKGIDPALLPYTKNYIITYPTGEIKQVAGLKAIAEEFKVSIANAHATIKRMSTGKIPKRGVFANIVIQEVV